MKGILRMLIVLPAVLLLFGCDGKNATGPEPDPITARIHYDLVTTAAAELPTDAALVWVRAAGGSALGMAEKWTYVFYSPGENDHFGFEVSGDEVSTITPQPGGGADATDPLPGGWMDSNTALMIVENSGGRDFRLAHENAGATVDVQITLYMIDTTGMGLGKQTMAPAADPLPIWEVWYITDAAESVGMVHGLTGEVIVFHQLFARYAPMTAKNTWQSAQLLYPETVGATLLTISTGRVQTDGKNHHWAIHYKTAAGTHRFIGFDGGVFADPRNPDAEWTSIGSWPSVGNGWIDSDAAMGIAEANGGSQYRSHNTIMEIELHLEPAGQNLAPTPVTAWTAFYAKDGGGGWAGFRIVINALTGAVELTDTILP